MYCTKLPSFDAERQSDSLENEGITEVVLEYDTSACLLGAGLLLPYHRGLLARGA